MNDTRCPTCASPVRVVSADEGTSHYEPVGTPGLDVERLARALVRWAGKYPDMLDAPVAARAIAHEYAALAGDSR